MEKLKEMLYTSDLTKFDWMKLFTPKVERKCIAETVYKSGEYVKTSYNEQGKPVKVMKQNSRTTDVDISEWEYQDNIVVERHGIQGQELTESVSVVRSDGLDYDGYFKYDEKGRIIENHCQTYEYGDDGKLESIHHKLSDVSWNIIYDDNGKIRIGQYKSEPGWGKVMDKEISIYYQDNTDEITVIICDIYLYSDDSSYVINNLWRLDVTYGEEGKVTCIDMDFNTNEENEYSYMTHVYDYNFGELVVDDYDAGCIDENHLGYRASDSYITIYHN